jgi:hypothetical protein
MKIFVKAMNQMTVVSQHKIEILEAQREKLKGISVLLQIK